MHVEQQTRRGFDSGFFMTARAQQELDVDVDAGEDALTERDRQLVADMELVAAMLANKPAAWREFQTKYERLIQRCILKVTRRFSSLVSPEDVREIHAQLLVSLLANEKHKLRSFDPGRGNKFSSWVGLLAINCAYDYLRTSRKVPPSRLVIYGWSLGSAVAFMNTRSRQGDFAAWFVNGDCALG